MTMINCPLDNCTYATPDVDADVTVSLLNLHNNVHINANISSSKPKLLKMDRPCIGRNCNEVVWNTFLQKLTMLKDSKEISETEKLCQLYQCCDKDSGDAILKEHADIVKFSKQELLCMINQLAVIPVFVVD